jgi:hypothetical protein
MIMVTPPPGRGPSWEIGIYRAGLLLAGCPLASSGAVGEVWQYLAW